jgi:serine/threonine protein kinase
MNPDETDSQEISGSGSNYSSTETNRNNKYAHQGKRMKYNVRLDSLHSATVVGTGATGQVIRLKDSNIVLKHCDSHNNPDGFKMLQNEISIYEKLSKLNLSYVPRYHGECELFGQYFIALEFIPGKHCDWRTNRELTDKLNSVLRHLKTVGVVHHDVRPENVLITPTGDMKLIDFGKAKME